MEEQGGGDFTNSLQDWLKRIEQLHPQEVELGLERIKAVGKKLGLIRLDCPVITVAGTNGKGSCVATLEAILSEQGYRVGAYFSPHLQRYNERIVIAGKLVSDDALCKAFNVIERVRDGISLTYFEWGTLAALWLFKKAQLDVVVLEVGLGGRLDAVNMVELDISVITTVDYDHIEWLGADRESIGREKAGIFRAGKPAVCGDFNPPKSVSEAALLLKAPLYCQGVDFGYTLTENQLAFWCKEELNRALLPISRLLPQNVSTALMVLQLLKRQMPISWDAVFKGLNRVFLPGRFQIVSQDPLVVFDVAHNPQGCRQICDKLQVLGKKGKTFAVVGMLREKDHCESFRPLLPLIDHWFVATLDAPRGCSAFELAKVLISLGVQDIRQFDFVLKAYQKALNQAQINDKIVVFGSFHAVKPLVNYLSECQNLLFS